MIILLKLYAPRADHCSKKRKRSSHDLHKTGNLRDPMSVSHPIIKKKNTAPQKRDNHMDRQQDRMPHFLPLCPHHMYASPSYILLKIFLNIILHMILNISPTHFFIRLSYQIFPAIHKMRNHTTAEIVPIQSEFGSITCGVHVISPGLAGRPFGNTPSTTHIILAVTPPGSTQ